MLDLQQDLRHLSEPGGPHADPHGRETVQLRPVRQEVHPVGSPEVAPERSLGRAAVRLHALLQELHRQIQPQVTHEEMPPQRPDHRLTVWRSHSRLQNISEGVSFGAEDKLSSKVLRCLFKNESYFAAVAQNESVEG